MTDLGDYRAFLAGKLRLADDECAAVPFRAVNPMLKPHQRDIVQWALRKGRAAIFAAFGLGRAEKKA